jgi:hypothetical protein
MARLSDQGRLRLQSAEAGTMTRTPDDGQPWLPFADPRVGDGAGTGDSASMGWRSAADAPILLSCPMLTS